MRLPVQRGNYVIDAEPYLREAFDALPYINPAHEPLFAQFFQKYWDRGIIERTMMRSGLPIDFFRNLKRLSEEEALQAISVRAFHNIVREGRRLEQIERRKGRLGDQYKNVRCHSDMGCRKARAMHGKTVPFERAGQFPLPGCKEAWCPCTWDFVSPWGGD